MAQAIPSAYARLNEAVAVLHEFHGAQALKAMDAVLEELDALYLQELRSVTSEKLQRRQGALEQVAALRRLIAGEAHVDGRT